MRKISLAILISILLVYSIKSYGARPLTTDDAGIVEKGKYEFESGIDISKQDDNPTEQIISPSFKYGLTERVDFGFSFPYKLRPKVTEKLGACSMGAKFSIIQDKVSFTITNELGSKEYSLNGIYSLHLKELDIHFNLGYTTTADENEEGETNYSFAFEKAFPDKKIDIVGEILGGKGLTDYLLGLRYHLPEIDLDFAYGNGFKENNKKITFGIHYEF